MTGADAQRPSAAARCEAAAWIARLKGPNRTEQVDAGLKRWLADDPEHAVAFELLTDTWEKSARLGRRPLERLSSWNLAGFRTSFSRAAIAVAACSTLAVMATIYHLHSDSVTTDVGELRTLTLDDGTRVHLNTATRVRVSYDGVRRGVTLERGEALFDVAHRPGWPFIVTAGGRQIRALGTEFVVRSDSQDLAVTLVQGKVDVAPAGTRPGAPAAPDAEPTSPQSPSEGQTFTLTPGERLTFVKAQSPRIDWPSLQGITAWERGQVAFDNTSLAAAAHEMNRYSRRPIVLAGPAVAAIRISGLFATGDSASFAAAVAHTFHLKIENQGQQIVLAAPDLGAGP